MKEEEIPRNMIVQIYNPRGYWVKIDREKGKILQHSINKFENIPVVNAFNDSKVS